MADHQIGTREEWHAARAELAKLEAEYAQLGQKVTDQRRQLPWVPVEKDYEFDTEDGKKTLAELFDGRSQLLAYNIMFGPDYEVGACPGCTNLGDELEGTRVHLNHRDVTLICFSRAPERDRLPHLHGVGPGPVRRAVPRLPARAHAAAGRGRPAGVAQGRVSRL